MASITKITMSGQAAHNYGDGCTEADAAGYRAWIREQLEREFPTAAIEINEREHTYATQVEIDDESDYQAARDLRDAVEIFAAECWDKCPWDWVAA